MSQSAEKDKVSYPTRRESPLTVGIDARILPGQDGGIEQVLIGLAHGLGKLQHFPETYTFIGQWENPDLLAPYIGPNQRIVAAPPPTNIQTERAKNLLGPFRKPAGILKRRMLGIPDVPPPSVPASDGFFEQMGIDVLHLTYPMNVVATGLPTVFSIYDLQHRHFPQFFPEQHLRWREHVYPAMFDQARFVVADSTWVKRDVAEKYFVSNSKLYAVPLASPTELYERVSNDLTDAVVSRFKLPSEFILYPALTYSHKNHVKLLEAIALLRDRYDCSINLICTGTQKHHWPTIQRRLADLRLESQVKFLGFVKTAELRALYRLSKFVVLPSLFEGAGLPLLEAFRERKAVACSDIAAFREYGGAAALFFDPSSTESIAEAIKTLVLRADIRRNLEMLGQERSGEFSWERSAKMYRAIYLKAAGREVTREDEELLRHDEYLELEPTTI